MNEKTKSNIAKSYLTDVLNSDEFSSFPFKVQILLKLVIRLLSVVVDFIENDIKEK